MIKTQFVALDQAVAVPEQSPRLDFSLPPELEAHEPPEARGLTRDSVRLMVSYRSDDRIMHACFDELPRFLVPGDLLVVNTSGTFKAALRATRADGTPLELHLSTELPTGVWTVELRRFAAKATEPYLEGTADETLTLPGGAMATLHVPYPGSQRLWIASIHAPAPLHAYLHEYGYPIRYGYVPEPWDIQYYQTVYATETGSAEMPSAGRSFTPELITRLVAQGVQIVPLLLHTGVASLESHEPPFDEYYRVSPETARSVNYARAERRRVIAVGTTVIRALESVTDMEGVTWPGAGWTRLLVTPARGIRSVNGLLTGLHEPRSTHLQMLEALAGREHLKLTYAAALKEHYLWHEFGDLHLILP